MSMKQALLSALLVAAACNTTVTPTAIGEFTSPTGMAATGAGDRDVLFIANTGRDSLRALQICNALLPTDGGVNPADTCPAKENLQFIPAPIRVFAATIETGNRPLRVAGVRMERSNNSGAGVALVAGADSTLAVVDARALIDAQRVPGVTTVTVPPLDVGAQTIDVVAANPMTTRDIETVTPAGTPATAFVATQTDLVVLEVKLDPSEFAQTPTVRASCKLSPVVPTKLAVVPSGDQVFVADGAGDGVVAIATSTIVGTGGACTMDRISAGGRSVRFISLSPRWYETVQVSGVSQPVEHAAGELLMMVLEPRNQTTPGMDLDPGGVLFAETGRSGGPKGIVPVPPFGLQETGQEPMQPISLPGPGLTVEGAFLRAVPPSTSPVPPDLVTCPQAPCTPLYVGQPSTSPTQLFNLLAAVTATDGTTTFIDVPRRRLVNRNAYAVADDSLLVPTVDRTPAFSPVTVGAPVLTITSALEPGVAHSSSWLAIWHSQIPGLERRGGTVRQATAGGPMTFTVNETSFKSWQDDPAIRFGVGDVVSFGAYGFAGDVLPGCQAVVNGETPYRFELPITDIGPDPLASGSTVPNTLTLAVLPDTPQARGFVPDCSIFSAVAEIRTGGAQPWLVFDGLNVKGRVQPDGMFVAHQRRFDYPRQAYSAPPLQANDVAFTLAITGNAPTIPKSGFTWAIGSGESVVSYRDTAVAAGFATTAYAYSSPRYRTLLFSSITGSNELLQADPGVLGSTATGVLAYR
jgi:hypothetical protein